MLTFKLLLSSCCFLLIGFSQEQIPIQSKGTMPHVISQHLQQLSPQQSLYPLITRGNVSDLEMSQLLIQFYNSGLVVYGDPITAYCQKEVDDLLLLKNSGFPQTVQLFTVKSNYAGIFSSGDSVVFITTGLLAQLTHSDQLRFFLLKQLLHIQLQHPIVSKNFASAKTYNDRIQLLCKYSQRHEELTDSLATVICIKNGFSVQEIPTCMDVIAYADLPFEDLYVPTNYFSSPLMYVPPSHFDVMDKKGVSPNENPYGIADKDSIVSKRKVKLLALIKTIEVPVSNSNSTSNFIEIRNIARLQSVHEHIVQLEYAQALYAIFILEKTIGTSDYLNRMKSHAWLGLVRDSYTNSTTRAKRPVIGSTQSESVRFFRVLTKLNSTGKAAFALRIISDLIAISSPETQEELTTVRSEIVQLLANSGRFPLNKFSTTPFDVAVNTIPMTIADSVGNKYDKLAAERNQTKTIAIDTNEFYFYGISDLIQDSTFVQSIRSNATKTIRTPRTFTELLVVDPSITLYHKHTLNTEKTAKREASLEQSITEIGNIKQFTTSFTNPSSQTEEMTTIEYNERALYLSILNQLYYLNQYQEQTIPIDYQQIRQLKSHYKQDYLAITLFENHYRLNPKGYHFLSFMVAPLPFMIPDLIIGGNHSQFTMLYLNTLTGRIEQLDHENFRDPLTKQLIKGRIYNSLNNFQQLIINPAGI